MDLCNTGFPVYTVCPRPTTILVITVIEVARKVASVSLTASFRTSLLSSINPYPYKRNYACANKFCVIIFISSKK